jgi:hypothetical protein
LLVHGEYSGGMRVMEQVLTSRGVTCQLWTCPDP